MGPRVRFSYCVRILGKQDWPIRMKIKGPIKSKRLTVRLGESK